MAERPEPTPITEACWWERPAERPASLRLRGSALRRGTADHRPSDVSAPPAPARRRDWWRQA